MLGGGLSQLARLVVLPVLPTLLEAQLRKSPPEDIGRGVSSCGTAKKPPNPLPTMTLLRASPPNPP